MAEYIERERLKELLKSHYFPTDQPYESDRNWAVGFNAGLDKAIHKIHYAPAAEVAPVVRCKDCKHWKKGDFMGGDTPDSMEYGGGCPLVRFARYESDFCSKGGRKEAEDDD